MNRFALLDPLARRLLRGEFVVDEFGPFLLRKKKNKTELLQHSHEDSSLRLVQVKMAISRLHTVLETFKRALRFFVFAAFGWCVSLLTFKSPDFLPQALVLSGDGGTVLQLEQVGSKHVKSPLTKKKSFFWITTTELKMCWLR